MIGTELQEFQKWLEYCDFKQVEGLRGSDDARSYSVSEIDNERLYSFWSHGHSAFVTVEFDDNGNFNGFGGWD